MIGELSLGGEIRSVPGVLPMVAALSRRGIRRVVVAASAVEEARLVDGIEIVGVESLTAAVELIARLPRRETRHRRESSWLASCSAGSWG
jgi:predicted ATPase with chaperone activity